MAVAIRVLVLLLLVALSGCYKTSVPGYGSSHSKYSKASPKSYTIYTVRRGDTLYSIGKRFGIDHKLLARRNRITWPYTIYVGQHLSISGNAPRSEFYMPMPKAKRVTSKRKTASPSKRTSSRKAVKKTQPKKSSYRAPAANGSGVVKLRWPVSGKLTSRFGRRGSRMHDGIDIGAKEGTPVYAAADGEVVYSDQRLSGYGKLVIIRHSRDMFTAYAHNQRNLVRKGDRVKSGTVIARVGKTGRASGPHLHFEVRRGTTPVDPLAYLPRR